MRKDANKRILAVVTDLFFTVKISDAAKRAGMQVEFVKDEATVLEMARAKPSVIILDLNAVDVQPIELI